MTKFEKRLLAGILSVVLCGSSLWTTSNPVNAAEDKVAAKTVVSEKKEEQKSVKSGNGEIGLGTHTTEITEMNQRVFYSFTPMKTGIYRLEANATTSSTTDPAGGSYEIVVSQMGSRVETMKDHTVEYIFLTAGGDCRISMESKDSLGTITWSLQEHGVLQKKNLTDMNREEALNDTVAYELTIPETATYKLNVPDIGVGVYDYMGEKLDHTAPLSFIKDMQYYIQFDKTTEPFSWSATKEVNNSVELTEGKKAYKDQMKCQDFLFTPAKSGKYYVDMYYQDVFWSGEYGVVEVLDETGTLVTTYEGSALLDLEQGKQYRFVMSFEGGVYFSIISAKMANADAELGKDIPLTDFSTVYKFVPSQTASYEVLNGNMTVINADNRTIVPRFCPERKEWEAISDPHRSGDTRMLLEAGNTYYFVADRNLETVKIVADKCEGDYSYRVKPDGKVQILKYFGKDKKVVIPEKIAGKTVAYIGNAAFDKGTMTEVVIPDSVTKVETALFRDCKSLKKATIGRNLRVLGGEMFVRCTSLTDVVYLKNAEGKSSVTKIEYSAFGGCSSLENLQLPESVTMVKEGFEPAFAGTKWYANQPSGFVYVNNILYGYKGAMPKNTELVVKEGTVSIAESAFYMENIKSVKLPDSLTMIGAGAFAGTYDLDKIENTDQITYVGVLAFDGTTWYDNQPAGELYIGKVLYDYKDPDYPEKSNLTSLKIKEGTVAISEGAVSNEVLLEHVEFPNSLVEIGEYAFVDCNSLKSVVIPKNVQKIGDNAFGYTFIYNSDVGTSEIVKMEGFTIHGVPHSEAERYAKENGFTFVPTVSYIEGDLNDDGKCNMHDARLMLRSVKGKLTLTEKQTLAADVNKDNVVDQKDLGKVLRYVCHKVTEL